MGPLRGVRESLHFDHRSKALSRSEKSVRKGKPTLFETTTSKAAALALPLQYPSTKTIQGRPFKTPTEGVGTYFSGDGHHYLKFIGTLKSYEQSKHQTV